MSYKNKADAKAYNDKYYLEHREDLLLYQKGYRENHREEVRKSRQTWYRKNREQVRVKAQEYGKIYYPALKAEVLSHYSGNTPPKCIMCGEARLACLSIDHIDGGGNKERRKLGLEGVLFYRYLKKQEYPTGYQTLCMNCQYVKREGNKHERSSYSE